MTATTPFWRLNTVRVKPSPEVNAYVESRNEKPLKDGVLASEFLRRPRVTYADLLRFIPAPEKPLDRRVIEEIEIRIKYAGYIKKAEESVAKMKKMEAKKIPDNIDFDAIDGLATEAHQKLDKIRPETIAQATRISGVNPADIAILSIYIERGKIAKIHA